jgi:ABC-type nitrate/sulfonate/bicarbonate transport system ATPase subunit
MHEWFLDTFDKLEISALFITHDVDEAILISDRIYVIKGSPAKVEGEIAVLEPKPRGGDFILSDVAVALKRQIRGKIA